MDGNEAMSETAKETAIAETMPREAPRRSFRIFAACALVCLSLASCRDSRSLRSIDLPSTPVVSESDRFALVLDPYIALRDEPGPTGITVSHVRRGEVYPITGKRILDDGSSTAIWVRLGDGWCALASVELYSSREKAITASARFSDSAQ